MFFSGYGDAAPPPKKSEFAASSTVNQDLPVAVRNACKAAARARQYPDYLACYNAVRAGAPVPTADLPVTAEQAEINHTRLYVGLAIAAVTAGVGAYLITK
jgi:hypothetical protein